MAFTANSSWTRIVPVLVSVVFFPLFGAELYVSPKGNARGDGSRDAPWSLERAFTGTGINPGDTLYLLGGTYLAASKDYYYRSYIKGEADKPVTVRPFGNERVVIDGGIDIREPWTIFRDLEVMSSLPPRQTLEVGPFPSDIPQPSGFWVVAPNTKLINNVVHDESTGISAWRDAPNSEFHGNIVYYHGWRGPDRAHGHGVYMQNNDGRKVLQENITFQQFGIGLQFYSTDNSFVDNFQLEGNVIFSSGLMGGLPTRNIHLGGGRVAANPVIRENFTYFDTAVDLGGDNNVGYYPDGAGCSNLIMEKNVFVSGTLALTLFKSSPARIADNLFYGGQRNFRAADFPSNTYVDNKSRPKGANIYVRPNLYEPGRANVTIYNWDRRDSVAVDLAPAKLPEGALFEVRDVQNYFGPPALSGRYRAGQSLMFPMTLTAVATPIGNTPIPPKHTEKEFGSFVVRPIRSTGAGFRQEVEAEIAYRSGPVTQVDEGGSQSGSHVRFDAADDGLVAFGFELPREDYYAIWCRVRAVSAQTDALTVEIDEKLVDTFDTAESGAPGWQWVRLNGRAGIAPLQLDPRLPLLAAGRHVVSFRGKDAGVEFDTFLITDDLDFVPGRPTPASTPEDETGPDTL